MSRRFQKAKSHTIPPSGIPGKPGGAKTAVAATVRAPQKSGPKPVLLDLDKPVTLQGQPLTVRELITNLGRVSCTLYELAMILGMSEPTLNSLMLRQPEIATLWQEAKATSKISLRHKLHKLANTQAGAAIFLAKNELGMRDQFDVKAEVEHTHSVSALLKEIDGKFGKVIEHDAHEAKALPNYGKVISE